MSGNWRCEKDGRRAQLDPAGFYGPRRGSEYGPRPIVPSILSRIPVYWEMGAKKKKKAWLGAKKNA